MIFEVLSFVSVELSARCDLVFSAKRCPVHPLSVHTQVLVSLAVSDKDSLIGLQYIISLEQYLLE